MDEPFPEFSSSQKWYDISMFCTDFHNNLKVMSSSGHARAIYEAYSALNISQGAGEGCYGNGLSLPSMRAMAVFPSNEKGFFLPRGGLHPPVSLLQLVFPKLDEWYYRFKQGDGVDHNYALDGFLRLLFFFREFILQDSVLLMDEYPHTVFQDPLFSSP